MSAASQVKNLPPNASSCLLPHCPLSCASVAALPLVIFSRPCMPALQATSREQSRVPAANPAHKAAQPHIGGDSPPQVKHASVAPPEQQTSAHGRDAMWQAPRPSTAQQEPARRSAHSRSRQQDPANNRGPWQQRDSQQQERGWQQHDSGWQQHHRQQQERGWQQQDRQQQEKGWQQQGRGRESLQQQSRVRPDAKRPKPEFYEIMSQISSCRSLESLQSVCKQHEQVLNRLHVASAMNRWGMEGGRERSPDSALVHGRGAKGCQAMACIGLRIQTWVCAFLGLRIGLNPLYKKIHLHRIMDTTCQFVLNTIELCP